MPIITEAAVIAKCARRIVDIGRHHIDAARAAGER
jgi:hypothetical protein